MGSKSRFVDTSGKRIPKKAKINETEVSVTSGQLQLNQEPVVGGATPSLPNHSIQYNKDGVLYGDSLFVRNPETNDTFIGQTQARQATVSSISYSGGTSPQNNLHISGVTYTSTENATYIVTINTLSPGGEFIIFYSGLSGGNFQPGDTISIGTGVTSANILSVSVGQLIMNDAVFVSGPNPGDIISNGHGVTASLVNGGEVPDTFDWTDGTNSETNVGIGKDSNTLSNGVVIYFNSQTGHDIGNTWTWSYTVTSQEAYIGLNSNFFGTLPVVGMERVGTDGSSSFISLVNASASGGSSNFIYLSTQDSDGVGGGIQIGAGTETGLQMTLQSGHTNQFGFAASFNNGGEVSMLGVDGTKYIIPSRIGTTGQTLAIHDIQGQTANLKWANGGGGGTPDGNNGDIQFNYNGSFCGDSTLNFDKNYKSAIIGGFNNRIVSGSCNSAIIGGFGFGAMGVYNSSNSAIIGGYQNGIKCSDAAVAIGGRLSRVYYSNCSSIFGSFCGNIQNSVESTIIGGGRNPSIYNSYGSLVIGNGDIHNSSNAGVFHGANSQISYSDTSGIFGSIGSSICHGAVSNIFGGNCNQIICDTQNSTIFGGRSNILGYVTVDTAIVAGQANKLYCSDAATIIGGVAGKLTGSSYSSIIGGYCNQLFNSCGSAIIGGRNLSLIGVSNTVMVPQLIIANMPSSDPHISGALFSCGGMVAVSAG